MGRFRDLRRLTAIVGSVAIVTISLGGMPGPAAASPMQEIVDLSGSLTAPVMARTVVGRGIPVSNVTFVGDERSAGEFSELGETGFFGGVVLSTGQVANRFDESAPGDPVVIKGNVVGPNASPGTTTRFGTAGDVDLDALVSEQTFDAAALEFDFVPTGSTVEFEYVFGSEEYLDRVGSNNDVFGFFINGTNCATVGSPPVPVAVNNVTPEVNAALYRDNARDGEGVSPIDVEMDGLTTVLTCTAAVTPNVPNHLKIAIADVGDDTFDSNVFVGQGRGADNVPPIAGDDDYTTPVDTALVVPAPGVLANDHDPNGDTFMAIPLEEVAQPAHGTVELSSDGSFSYTPVAGFVGTDSFVYGIYDEFTTSNPATVTIVVTAATTTTTDVATTTTTDLSTTTSTLAQATTSTTGAVGPSSEVRPPLPPPLPGTEVAGARVGRGPSPGSPSSTALARTGSSSDILARWGVIALVVGCWCVGGARLRQRRRV